MTSAEIITIGTEILLGEIVDTNTRYLAHALRGLGIDVYRTITIGDNLIRLADTIREATRRADIIITTGGLGPTVDDPTREAVARAVGVETEFREELWEQIKTVIARYGRTPGENQKRQAMVPQGALVIPNPIGTAPSFILEYPSTLIAGKEREVPPGVIISLPGVPQEMEFLFTKSVVPYLQTHFKLHEIIKVRILHSSGLGEGMIDEKIGDFEKLINPTVGLSAHTGIVDIRITAKADNESDADELINKVESAIRELLGEAIFGVDQDTLEQVALDAVKFRGWNLVIVEAGLDDRLTRVLSPFQPSILLEIISLTLLPGELPDRTRDIHKKTKSKVVLGVALFSSESSRSIELHLITPDAENSLQLTYGGPPNSAPRWAANTALNWLRLTAQGIA